MKRLLDIALSSTGFCLLLPLLLIISIVIKVDSFGPIFYIQERVGKDGKLFRLFKFRTMHPNADELSAITIGRRDLRVTRVGYFLRRGKLDELPQLINVILGDLSLVGPRPELKKFVDLYNPEQMKVISVKPGITDFASIKFRNENELLEGKNDPLRYYIDEIMPAKLKLNLSYIEKQSIAVDIKIILQTVFLLFNKRKT